MITPSNATVAGTCFRVLPVGLAVAVSLLLASCDMGDCDDCGFDGTTVTVLVAYTSLAAQESGDIDAYVEKAMGETNEVFDNSETNVRLSMDSSLPDWERSKRRHSCLPRRSRSSPTPMN